MSENVSSYKKQSGKNVSSYTRTGKSKKKVPHSYKVTDESFYPTTFKKTAKNTYQEFRWGEPTGRFFQKKKRRGKYILKEIT